MGILQSLPPENTTVQPQQKCICMCICIWENDIWGNDRKKKLRLKQKSGRCESLIRYVRRLWPAHAHYKKPEKHANGFRIRSGSLRYGASAAASSLDLVQWHWRPLAIDFSIIRRPKMHMWLLERDMVAMSTISAGDSLWLQRLQRNYVTLTVRGTKDAALWTQLNNWPTTNQAGHQTHKYLH